MQGEGGARTSGASELRHGGIKYFICNHNNLGKEFFFFLSPCSLSDVEFGVKTRRLGCMFFKVHTWEMRSAGLSPWSRPGGINSDLWANKVSLFVSGVCLKLGVEDQRWAQGPFVSKCIDFCIIKKKTLQNKNKSLVSPFFFFSCRLPLPPGAALSLWQNHELFKKLYCTKFPVRRAACV